MTTKPNPLAVMDAVIVSAERLAAGEAVTSDAATVEVARATRAAIAEIIEERDRLALRVGGLEALRPVWAQGWTNDSEAAQAASAALAQIWKALGVSNQTDAMIALRAALARFE